MSTGSAIGTTWHYYGNRLNLLPSNFSFPKMNLLGLMNHWFIPDLEKNIPAYRHLTPDELHMVSSCACSRRNVLYKMRVVMKMVEKFAVEKSVWKSSGWTLEDINKMYEEIKDCFVFCSGAPNKRVYQLSWRTIYDKLQNQGGNEVDI